jgi:hypothetical protein
MPKMRLGWYAGVSYSFAESISSIMTSCPELTMMVPGFDSPCGLRRAVGIPSAAELLLGYGLSVAEQLLPAGLSHSYTGR